MNMAHKTLYFFIFALLSVGCNPSKTMSTENPPIKKNFVNITTLVNEQEFEDIKHFILQYGDQRTYRNIDNNNPHYQFGAFDAYLASDIGQRNINNDPTRSNFNQLTLADYEASIRYYELVLVRKGDLKAQKFWLREGMEERRVYLVDVYGRGLELMERQLLQYLQTIRQEMKAQKEAKE